MIPLTIGTVQDGKVVLDHAAMQQAIDDAIKAALAQPHPSDTTAAKPPIAHQEQMSSWLPSLTDVKDAALGGGAAIFTAKAIGKAVAPLAHPVLSDMAAWILLNKYGKNVLKGGALDAAKTVLMVDALRALFPIFDVQVNSMLASVPQLIKGAPIQVPAFGGGTAPTAPMRQQASQNQGGGSLVVNRLAVTNI